MTTTKFATRLISWALDHPTHEGESWEGRSGLLPATLGIDVDVWPDVAAYLGTMPFLNRDPHRAPPGAVHLFSNGGPKGLLAIDLDGGGLRVLTTGTAFDMTLGIGLGIRQLGNMRANLRYAGWIIPVPARPRAGTIHM